MTYRKRSRAALCLALAAVLLLSACGFAVGPQMLGGTQTLAVAAASAPEAETVPTPENAGARNEVTVDNIDDFLAALASHTVICLQPGTYDLSTAETYGRDTGSAPYYWRDLYDGYELVLRDLEDLVITGRPGEDGAEVLISAVPRYANVLGFERCSDLTLSAFTAGHTTEPGLCCGGVLYFESCRNARVTDCRLYGCGILGIQAVNCDTLWAEGCAIYDCSNGAAAVESCRDVRLIGCEVYDCGMEAGYATALFDVKTTTGFAVLNSEVHNNLSVYLLRSISADEVYLLGTAFIGNRFDTYFTYNLISPMVGGCSFTDNEQTHSIVYDGRDFVWLPEDGGQLAVADLDGMALDRSAYPYDGPKAKQTAAVTGIPGQDGMEYHVTTVDEFLAAIGSDTTIYLDAELFDLSTAMSYGGYGGTFFYWVDLYDGPSLVITGVQNLRIIGQGKDKTSVEALPRYADVLCFQNCENVTVSSLTAGHRKGEPGSCTGDVLAFENCRDVHVIDCGLFGCGVFGIRANNSTRGEILRTEIYECSSGAAQIWRSDGFTFTDCSVHDCFDPWNSQAVNLIVLSESGDCSYNGSPLRNNASNEVGDGAAPAADGWEDTGIVNLPLPKDTSNAGIRLFFYETEIKSDGFTMHVGDEPITLTAAFWDGVSYVSGSFAWGVSDPSVVDFRPSENGLQCSVQPVAAAEITLTVINLNNGQTLQIPVHIAD